jgi:hypothetical protein
MRPILLLVFTAALFLPAAAFAFDTNSAGPRNPDGTAFSDPDEAPVIPGLQAYGIDSDSAGSSGVFIPPSPASSDLPPLLYSSPAFRTR